jgi:hypothetical protein
MKMTRIRLIAAMVSVTLILSWGWSGVGSLAHAAGRDIKLINSYYAQTVSTVTLRGGIHYFDDMKLQEADNFDGYNVDFELTVPLLKDLQFRFYYPAYTDGDAIAYADGNGGYHPEGIDVDISGSGGILDFPSINFDYQFMHADGPEGYNLSVTTGVGYILRYLMVEDDDNKEVDRYNHRGAVWLFGLRMDHALNSWLDVVANLGGRYYWDSDDIYVDNPDDDIFWLVDASLALVYNTRDSESGVWVYPALELVYQGDLGDYNKFEIVPQLIVPLGKHLDVTTGVGVGLANDGPDYVAHFNINLRY